MPEVELAVVSDEVLAVVQEVAPCQEKEADEEVAVVQE